MADFWNRYGMTNKEDEEKDREKNNLSFWERYGTQTEEALPSRTKTDEPEPDSFLGKLAQRGVTIELPEPEKKTEETKSTGTSLLSGSQQAKSATTNLFTERLGQTSGAERAKQEKAAAQEEEKRRNETVRNQEWLDSLRSAEDIQKDLDAVKEQQSALDKKAFKDNALGVWYDLVGKTEKKVQANEETRAAREGLSERQKALEDELAERKWADYERLRNNEDFEKNSQYKSTANGTETKLNPLGGYDSVAYDDPLYEYVNGNKEAGQILAMEKEENARQNGLLGFLVPEDTYNYEQVSEMTDDERAMYNYIYATKDADAAYEYLNYLRSVLYKRQMDKEKEEAAAYAKEHPILSTIGTIGLSPLRGAAYLGQAADYLTTGTVDQNAPYNRVASLPAAERAEVTNLVEKKWGKAGSFAYQTGVSMAEFLLNSSITGGKYADKFGRALSLAIMGTGAAPEATIEAKERGMNDTQAFAIGSIAGAAEVVTELVSIEALFSNPWEKTGLKKWLQKALYVGQNIAAEGSEEAASDVINWMADVLMDYDKSEWRKSIKEYQENAGMDENEAFVAALKDKGMSILMSAAGGALSGGLMASGAVTLDTIFSAAQKNQDSSQSIEAVRAANNARIANASQSAVEAAQTQAAEEGSIVLPTEAEAARAEGGGGELRMGAEPSGNLTPTAEEAELEERIRNARNVTEATGIRYGVDEKTIRQAEKYGRATGMTPEFYSKAGTNGTVENGMYDQATGKIYYNVNAKEKFGFTFGHEFTHTLEGTKEYKALSDLVSQRIEESGGDLMQMEQEIESKYERAGIPLKEGGALQEIVADWIGNNLSDEKTIREICRENPSLAKQVRDTLDNFITRLADMQGVVTTYEEKKWRNVVGVYDKYMQQIAEAEEAPAQTEVQKSAKDQNKEWLAQAAERWSGIQKGEMARTENQIVQLAKKTLEKNADGTYNISSGEAAENVFKQVQAIARELVENANVREDNEIAKQYEEPRQYLRETPIHYNRDTLVAERGGEEDFKEWRKGLRGILNLTSEEGRGLPIDTVFDEFAELYPGYVELTAEQDTDRLDELARVAQFMREQVKSSYVNPYEQDIDGAADEMAVWLWEEATRRLNESAKPKTQTARKPQPKPQQTETQKTAPAEKITEAVKENETTEEYLERMGRLYDAGEITEEEYNDAVDQAAEMESIGRGISSSTVERDQGPEGKIPAALKRITGRYSISDEVLPNKKRFSLSENIERVGELVAVHNLTPEQLYSSWEMGGFPAPSIAVVKAKQGHSNYGSVSVVFGPDVIDPKKDYRNNIYGADAYTPTYSNAYVAWEMLADKADELEDRLHDLSLNVAGGAFTASSSIIRRYYDNVLNVEPEDFARRLADLTEVKAAYLADKGENVERAMREIEPEYNERFTNKTINSFAEAFGSDFIDRAYNNETDETSLTPEQYEDIEDWFIRDKASKPPMNKNPETAIERAQKWADNNLYPVAIENVVRSAWNMMHNTQVPRSIVDTSVIQDNIEKLAKTEDVYNWILPQVKEIYGKRGVRNNKDQFTRSGNRRKFKDLYDDFNLSNVVEAMFREGSRGLNANPNSAEGLQSKTAKSYSNLDEVRSDSERLQTVDEDEYKRIKDALEERLEAVRHVISKQQDKGDTYIVNIDVGNSIMDAASPYATKERIQSAFRRNGLRINDATANELLSIFRDSANIPTMYFEAKPERNVQLNEIAAVVVPDDIQQFIKDAYTGSNVPVVEYKAGDENDRLEKLNSLNNVRFSLSEADTEERKHRYDYDTLIRKDDVKIVPMTVQEIPTHGKKLDLRTMADEGRKNASVLTKNGYTQRYVYISDIGERVLINPNGVKHGIQGNKTNTSTMDTAQVTYYLPEILRNSVAVNEMDPRTAKDGEYSYTLFGYAEDERGQGYLVKSTLNHFGDNRSVIDDIEIYNVLKGIKGKKINAEVIGDLTKERDGLTRNASASEISIAHLLDLVKSIHPEFLSEDVRKKLGVEDAERAEGLRYSVSDDTEDIGAIASLPTVKLRDNALRAENQLAASLAGTFGVSRNRTTDTYKQFRRETVRPIVEAMIQGQPIDADGIFRENWSGSLTEGQKARADFDEAMAEAYKRVRHLTDKAEEMRSQEEAKAVRDAELDSMIPDTTEELVKLGEKYKDAKKRRAAVMARLVLTEEDQKIVEALVNGEMTDEEANARSPRGIYDILQAAEAERAFRNVDAAWGRYTRRLAERRTEEADRAIENADSWNDKGTGIAYARETPERNFRDIAGKDAPALIDKYIRPVHTAEAASTRFKNDYIKRVKDLDLSRKVAKGNENTEAEAVQFLGEAEDNVRVLERMRNPAAVRDGQTLDEWRSAIEQFRQANPNLDYAKIDRAIKEFGTIYGELIEQMNRVLVENGYEPVNIRRGYFPHFNGGDDGVLAKFASLLGIKLESNALPTSINGLTSSFKPGKTWFGHALERTGFHTDYDAVQGFEGYIGGVSDVIHQTTNIRNLRALSNRIRYKMSDEAIRNRINEIEADNTKTQYEKEVLIQDLRKDAKYKLSNAVVWLDEYTNLLANKKSVLDRGVESLIGRKWYSRIKNLEGRVAANMIAGNLGSALTNFIPLNQAAAMIGDQNIIKGAAQTMANRINGDDFVNRSDFLTNRRGVDPLIQNRADKISEFLSKPMNIIDDFASEAIVRGAYNYYRKGGMDEESALAAADEFAAGVMADRSKGALPTIFGSKNPLVKLLTQFQVEVNNEFSTIFKDVPKGLYRNDKDRKNMVAVAAWTLMRYFIGAYLFNDLYESVVGRRAALDPVDILNDAVGDLTGKKLNNVIDMLAGEGIVEEVKRKNPSDAITETGKNTLEELPFIGGILGGGRIPIKSAMPDVETIIKGIANENWSTSKKLQTVGREVGGSALTYLLPPFAGGAAKKAVQTALNTRAGGRFVKNKEGEDQIQYPYFTDTPAETAGTVAKSLLFGPTATEGGRDWVENGFGSKSAKYTSMYRALTNDVGESQHDTWDLLKDLTSGDKDAQGKREAVVNANLSEEGKAVAMASVVTESESRKFRGAYEYGVTADEWAALYGSMKEYDENNNGDFAQKEINVALENITVPLSGSEGMTQGLFGGSTDERYLTEREKAVLWAAYGYKKNGKSWKQSNNPYDPDLGEQVIDWIDGLVYDEEEEEE